MRKFRHTLAAIILAAPGCVPNYCDPPSMIEETITIGNMPDMVLAPLVADCKTMLECQPLCEEVFMRQHADFAGSYKTCELTLDAVTGEDAVHYVATEQCIGGRRPAGYRGRRCGNAVGSYLAEQARLEAASVRAFADLNDDLGAIGAPTWLRRAMIAAAADEVRHAAICKQLARRYGVEPAIDPVAAAPRRTRRQLAIDNAIEGCVRETYGAVVAGYQARAAADPEVRRAMTQIAKDEAKHAELSWILHRWLWPQLSDDERREVEVAMARARAELRAAPSTADDPAIGLPSSEAAGAMLDQLDAQVWA